MLKKIAIIVECFILFTICKLSSLQFINIYTTCHNLYSYSILNLRGLLSSYCYLYIFCICRTDWKWEPTMLVKELSDKLTLQMCDITPNSFIYLLRRLPALQTSSAFRPITPLETSQSSSSVFSLPSNNKVISTVPYCDRDLVAAKSFMDQHLPKAPPRLLLRNTITQVPDATKT